VTSGTRSPNVSALVIAGLLLVWPAAARVAGADDWPDWRGPNRDGTSAERGLPASWSPRGEGLAWRAPYGSRSAPVVFGDRLYLLTASGEGATRRERVLCLDADTGKVVWEHPFNVFLSDVPPHRVAWASPVVDTSNGNVYAFGVGAHLLALSKDGKRLWERSLTEEFGAITTHGGRTVSPIVEGELVITSTLTSGWGEQARGGNRYFAFDKKTGETVWVASPQARHYDTNYSSPVAASIGGQRLIVMGGSDGVIHALKAQTGESVWKYEMSKRAILTSVVFRGNVAFVTHSEENLDTSEMGHIAAIDAAARGAIGKDQIKWRTIGWGGGFSSPVLDGNRIYEIDNAGVIGAFDVDTGKKLWEKILGTIQKASPVLADGKLYVGTENGKFYILEPGSSGVKVLDEDLLGTDETPEPIIASAAVARGRVYVASMENLYCIGPKAAPRAAPAAAAKPVPPGLETAPAGATAAHLQVTPTELVLKPGERVRFHARLFDDKGRFIREEPAAAWTLEQLRGALEANGDFVAASDAGPQAGLVKASASGLTGAARLRVIPPLPWSADFETGGEAPPRHWINATGKFVVRDVEGNKVLVKLADNPFTKRGRTFLGPTSLSDYTVEVDARAIEKRRQMGDAGLIAQRYVLVLFGNNQRLELQAWQPNTAQSVSAPFAWKPDTWYRLKLKVENLQDGSTRVQGKAWPAAEPEPLAWTLEKVDTMPHRNGSPGLYADATNEVFFDNLKVTQNR
jgi:outer membrane protein assembly factor BamB